MAMNAIPHEMSQDLLDLLDSREHISTVMDVSSDCNPSASMRGFAKQIVKRSGLRIDDVLPILRSTWNFRRSSLKSGLSPSEMLETVSSRLRSAGGPWDKEKLEEWAEVAAQMAEIISSISPESPFGVTMKAAELAFDRENVLHNTRIVTDVRPVFSEDAREVQEMVVTHSLIVDFTESNMRKEIHLALDAADIAALRSQCDRADMKAATLAESLSQLPWATVILPDGGIE